MLHGLSLTKRWVVAGLLAWLTFGEPPMAWPQSSSPALPPATAPSNANAPSSAAAQPPGTPNVSPAPTIIQESADSDGQGKEPESPWARSMPPSAAGRAGWFRLPPTGEGYYTFLDLLRGKTSDEGPPKVYHPGPSSYELDFSFLDKPGAEPVDFFDRLKRIPLWSSDSPWQHNLELSIGGEERYEFRNEVGGPAGRLNGIDDTANLVRTRVWGDLWFRDNIRIFAEFLDSEASYSNGVPPLSTDITRAQFLSLFADVKLGTFLDSPVYGRIGREEMNYGSTRLLASPDWTNIRRSYDGAKIFWHTEQLDIDGFWVRPILNLVDRFNTSDHTRQLAGLWTVYRPNKEQTLNLYYLYFDSDLPVRFGAARGGRGGYDNNTFGARWDGYHPLADLLPRLGESALAGNVMWDFEGAYQFGDWTARSISAGMSTTGLGYAFMNLPLQPQFWAYFDYASGTPHRADSNSTFETFNQLFPAGHTYFGYLDEVGRSNIHDLNFQLSIYPAKWITTYLQYHIFRLDQAGDALYTTEPDLSTNRFSPTGRAGTDVGDELDLLTEFQLGRHSVLFVGYSKMFSGSFINETGVHTSPEMFYMQYYFRW